MQNRAAVHMAVKVGSFIWRQFGVVSSENKLKVFTMKSRPIIHLTLAPALYVTEPETGGSWKKSPALRTCMEVKIKIEMIWT